MKKFPPYQFAKGKKIRQGWKRRSFINVQKKKKQKQKDVTKKIVRLLT